MAARQSHRITHEYTKMQNTLQKVLYYFNWKLDKPCWLCMLCDLNHCESNSQSTAAVTECFFLKEIENNNF